MTLEVRQMVLRAVVDEGRGDPDDAGRAQRAEGDDARGDTEQLKAEILAECRSWLLAQLQQMHER